MSGTRELLDRGAAEMQDVYARLKRLQSSHDESATLKQALRVHEELSRQISDAKTKLAKHEYTDAEAKALADRIESGMKEMIGIVSADEGSRAARIDKPAE